jgi:multidrug efflux pump subunit AcrB
MSLPRFSVNNQVLVNMMMVVLLAAGGIFAFTLVREMFPETQPDKIAISVLHLGVQPQELEKAVTIKIEQAVRDVDGIERIDSTVSEGMSTTIVTLLNEVEDVDTALQEVKNEVDAIEDLPDDLNKITINKREPQLPVISIAIYGEGDEAALKRAAIDLRDDLERLPGVSEVQINGTRNDEISVEIRPERLRKYNITFDEVAEAIRSTNLDISGGNLKGARQNISLRTLGEELRGMDLEDIVVRGETDGRTILLSDVAHVRDHFIESDLESYFNAKRAVHCVVYKTSSQDAIQIATLVKAFIAGKRNEPFDYHGFAATSEKPWYVRPFSLAGAGISWALSNLTGRPDPMKVYEQSRAAPFDHTFNVALHTDLARFVEGRLDLLSRNGRTGLILVLISLNLFLNWRVAMWAAVGLPVSFLGTFVIMWFLGATINLLTMFGLIIVLGIIVDDAIVIGENIYRHVEEGMHPLKAAVVGAEEVMWPVTVAVLTTIAAFAPLFFVRGQIGDFMGQLPIVVLAALSVSLIEALVILPAHLAHLPPHDKSGDGRASTSRFAAARRMLARVDRLREGLLRGSFPNAYERFLRKALRWRYVTLAVAVATLTMSLGLFAGGIVESVFIQKMDSETIICALEMPVGTTSKNVKQRLVQLSQLAVETPEVASVQMFVARQFDLAGAGATGSNDQSHLGQLIIELLPADERERLELRSSERLLAMFRNASQQLPGVNSVTWEAMHGGPGGKDVHIQITSKQFDDLVAVSDLLKERLRRFRGVFDIDDDFDKGKREIHLRLRESARPTGITVGMLGLFVRSAMYGRESRRMTRNREDVKIMVRYPEHVRTSVYDLESMWIPVGATPQSRGWVPLGEVATLTESESYSTIHRSQHERSVSVYAEVDDEVASTFDILAMIQQEFDTQIQPIHPDVRIQFLGSYEERFKAFGGLKLAFPVALLIIYMLLAGLFRSYLQPLVVMSAIPFGIQGAIVGHWVTGNPMTILSWIGMVALTGILVNDALVLVDFINKRIRAGMSPFEASVTGGRLRLRAILLTTLTTVAGLTPIMFETSFQAKFLIPMAVTLTFGLVFATALTLVIVPTLNMIYHDFVHLAGRTSSDVLVSETISARELTPQPPAPVPAE